MVTPKLPALRAYQLNLGAPVPPPGSFDPTAAERGRALFNGSARCSSCHAGEILSDVNDGVLHEPAETGMDPAYAARTSQKTYRSTPLRGLWQHLPYFHYGSSATLADVVQHYNNVLNLGLSSAQRSDLVEYSKRSDLRRRRDSLLPSY